MAPTRSASLGPTVIVKPWSQSGSTESPKIARGFEFLGEVVGPRQHCAKRAGGQTAHGLQELPALKSPRFKWCHGLQVTSLPVSVIANSTGAGAFLTCSTLFSVEQPSIAEENEPQRTQRTQRKKPMKDIKELCAPVRQISYDIHV